MKTTKINGKELSAMTLGTVQLGMNYGIANQNGKPSENQSQNMLYTAVQNGVTSFDTARSYGNSENVLGKFFMDNPEKKDVFLTSKLSVGLPDDSSEQAVESSMFRSVEASLEALNVESLDCLMLHNASDMTKYGHSVSKTLEKLISKGYIKMAGVSVYEPEELDIMMQDDIYRATQIPMSVFDRKWISQGYIERLKEKGISVFVRSVFLQGLFFLEPDKITDPILLEYAKEPILKLRHLCSEANMSIAEFAISYIRDISGVTSLVLGADTQEQVLENIRYMNAPQIPQNIRKKISESFRDVNMEKIMEVLRRPKS